MIHNSDMPPSPQHDNTPIDTFALTRAVYEELKSILLSYSGVMPPTLIEMGKAALSTPGKVMSTPFEGDPSLIRAPRWPFCIALSYQAASGGEARNNWASVVPAAAAVEIAMAAADLLDEVTDQDPSPIIEQYGVGQALNTANLMLVMAQQSLLHHAIHDGSNGGQQSLANLDALQNMLVEAAVGQHLDMLYERMGPAEVTVEMSNTMTQKKAGALISGACRIGALTARAPGEVVDLLARFGREIGGIAQLENDLQDVLPRIVMGEARPLQKTDLLLRKRTLPIVFALNDDSEEPNTLQRAYSSENTDMDDEELREAVLAAGGIQFGELILRVHRENALVVLAELETLRPGAANILSQLLPPAPDAPPSEAQPG